MPTLPAVMVTLLLPFEHLFDPRTWRKAQLLAVGAILSPGKRTVSSALNILGIGQHGDFAVYHHVLNRARWSPLQLSRVRLLLVVGRLGSSTEPLVFGIDETVERRWGRKIAAQGRYRDPVRSKDDQVVMTPGLQWVSLMLLTRIGWAGRHWALPFLTALVVLAPYGSPKESISSTPSRCPLGQRRNESPPSVNPSQRNRKGLSILGSRRPQRNWNSADRDGANTKRTETNGPSANNTPASARKTNGNVPKSLVFAAPALSLRSQARQDVHHAPQNTGGAMRSLHPTGEPPRVRTNTTGSNRNPVALTHR